jgi:hypothetical protein
MIYEKKTLELLADQRLLSRFNKNTLKSDNNNNNVNKNININIIKNINNHYSLKTNNFNIISKYSNYIILLIFIFIFKNDE